MFQTINIQSGLATVFFLESITDKIQWSWRIDSHFDEADSTFILGNNRPNNNISRKNNSSQLLRLFQMLHYFVSSELIEYLPF